MRRSLVWLTMGGLFAGLHGCSSMMVKDPTVRVPAPAPGESVVIKKEDDSDKHPVKAVTHIRYAKLYVASAAEQKSPQARETLYESARQRYETALQIEPKNQEALLGLATLWELWEKPEMARTAYQNALKQLPQESVVWFAYGMFANRRREFDLGADCIRKACSLDPTNVNYGNALGFTLARGGHTDESLVQFKQTVGEARAYYNLARMSYQFGQEAQCRQYLQAALQADPNLRDARDFIAQLDAPAKPAEEKTTAATTDASPADAVADGANSLPR